jgi:arylsulfatase A-like enzyme
LQEQKVDRNTIVFFTGDNGGLSTLSNRSGPTCELPLRAGKGWTYEGGIRVPFIVYDPAAKGNGRVCDVPVVNTDFFATILDCCNMPLKPELHKDSVSIKPLLDGEKGVKRTSPLVWHFPHYHGSGFVPGSCIREGEWKVVESYHDETVELYNLKNDIGEKQDLSKVHPEKTALLRRKMHDYLKETGASMAKANPDYAPNAKPAKNRKKK